MAQQQLLALGMAVDMMPLEAMLERIRRTHVVGPITDPTGYQAGLPDLQSVERLAKSLLGFQRVARKLAEPPEVAPEVDEAPARCFDCPKSGRCRSCDQEWPLPMQEPSA